MTREEAQVYVKLSREDLAKINSGYAKHYDTICAFANGEEIETFSIESNEWYAVEDATFNYVSKYRVKSNDVEQPTGQWKPKWGEQYFCIYGSGNVIGVNFHNETIDNDHVSFGNCFRTREEAEAARERVRAALKGETISKMEKVESLDGKLLTGNEKALLRHLRDSKVVDIFNGETATTVVFDNEKNNACFAEAIECIMWGQR